MKNLFTLISLATTLSFSVNGHAQVGIGTDTPHASAILEIQSTTKGLLLPRFTQTQMIALQATAAEGLMVYCTDCTPKCLYLMNDTEFLSSCTGEAIAQLPFETIVGPTGKKWADRDLGASAAPTSYADANPDIKGDIYQWGRTNDGHEDPNSLQNSTSLGNPVAAGTEDSLFITVDWNNVGFDWLTVGDDNRWNTGTNTAVIKTVNDPCPDGFRVPTRDEIYAEYNTLQTSLGSTPTSTDLFTALKWNANDKRDARTGAVGSSSGTRLWTNTTSGTGRSRAIFFTSSNSTFQASSQPRSNGFAVRCIEE